MNVLYLIDGGGTLYLEQGPTPEEAILRYRRRNADYRPSPVPYVPIDIDDEGGLAIALICAEHGRIGDEADDALYKAMGGDGPQVCRMCGCTDADACIPSCHWHRPNLCSACATAQGVIPRADAHPPHLWELDADAAAMSYGGAE